MYNIRNNLAMARKKQLIIEHLQLDTVVKVSGYFDQMESEIESKFKKIKTDILNKVDLISKI